MVELGTALRELAEGQQPLDGPDAGDLWRQGRRRARRHRAIGAGVVAALALTIAAAGVLVPRPTVVMPAGDPHRDALPRSIYRPSMWLAGTDDRGPLGRLAVLGGSPRAGERNGLGIFGISARTGEYRFLDLHDRAAGTDVRLSPDGRHVAYWLTGRTTGTPYPNGDGDVVTGIAVYDAVTGRLARYDVPSRHGLNTGGLAWMDDSTLVLEYGFQETAHTSSGFAGRLWKVGSEAPVLGIQGLDLASIVPNPDGTYFKRRDVATSFLQVRRRSDTLLGGQEVGVLTLPDLMEQRYADATTEYTQLSRSGNLVAVVLRNATTFSEPLVTGTVDATGKVRQLVLVDKLQDVQVLGWQDDHTVLVLGHLIGKPTALMSVDLSARHARRVGAAEPLSTDPGLQVTRELVGTPLVRGLRPPDPMDPRIRRGLFLSGGLVVGAALWLLRRRRLA